MVFPDSARVWQESKLPLQSNSLGAYLQFQLPTQARPETLGINLEEGQNLRLSDVHGQKAKFEETEQVQELRQEIQKLEQKKQAANAELKALAARISFWEEQAACRAENRLCTWGLIPL